MAAEREDIVEEVEAMGLQIESLKVKVTHNKEDLRTIPVSKADLYEGTQELELMVIKSERSKTEYEMKDEIELKIKLVTCLQRDNCSQHLAGRQETTEPCAA